MARSNEVVRTFTMGDASFQVFACQTCGCEFSRPTMRGVKPLDCPEHTQSPVRVRPIVPPVANVPTTVNPVPENPRHYRYSLIRAILGAGVHVFLVGPAGSGKTTVADQIAEDMDLPFYSESGHELMTAYDLLGFKNAMGDFILTYLCQALEFGGIFLMDEMDAMNSAALVAMNRIAALKPGSRVRIGEREVVMHSDFHIIGGGNTWGRGATAAYQRQVLDFASINRFARLDFGYDAHLEFLSVGIPVPSDIPANPRYKRGNAATDADIEAWVREVQRYRAAFLAAGIEDAGVTPRASIYGAAMLRNSIHKDYVVASLITAGLSEAELTSVNAHM